MEFLLPFSIYLLKSHYPDTETKVFQLFSEWNSELGPWRNRKMFNFDNMVPHVIRTDPHS